MRTIDLLSENAKEIEVTKEDAAAALDGDQYRSEGSSKLFAEMKAAGLVAVFGGSDDLVEFRGAIDDEVGAYGGTTVLVDREGLLPDRRDIDDDTVLARFFVRKPMATKIKALWCDDDEHSWTYETKVAHASFEIMEDDDHYCRGIVFALADLSS